MQISFGLLARDPRMARIIHSGKPIWSYEANDLVKSISPLRYSRANAWRAKYFGFQGIGFWCHSRNRVDLWFPGTKKGQEYALVYPGRLPVPSARWEAVRDGLEDIAAITLLEQRIEAEREKIGKRRLIAQAQDAIRIALNDVMELSDWAFMESRDYLRPGDRRIWHTWADIETFRRHRATIARLTLALSR